MNTRIEFESYVNPAGFKRGMVEMEAAANATNTRLQNMLSSKISAVSSRMSGMDPNSWEYVQAGQRKATLERSLLNAQNAMFTRNAQARVAITAAEQKAEQDIWIAGQAEWRTIQETQTAEMLANFEKQRIAAAALKAEQLGLLTSVAMGAGASSSGGAFGGHAGGGISGIIRETLVLFRELGRGNYTRMAGSVTLLAQYMGLLGFAIKSTAAGALQASAAQTTLSVSMAQAALAAEAKAQASLAAFQAETVDTEATLQLALADEASAVAARAAAVAQEAKAVASAQAAEMALASASVTVSAFGWIGIAALILAVPLYLLVKHFWNLSKAQKNFAELTDATRRKFTDEAEAVRDDARAHEALHKWLQNELDDRKSLEEVTDRRIRQLNEEMEAQKALARAKGESAKAINQMEIQQLQKEQQLVQLARDKASLDLEIAEKSLASADKAFTKNPSENGVDLRGATKAMETSGKIVDAVNDAADQSFGEIYDLAEKMGNSGKGGEKISMHSSFFSGLQGLDNVGKENGTTWDQLGAATGAAKQQSSFDVKVDGKNLHISLKEATEAYDKNKKYVDDLTKAQDQLADDLDKAKGDVKEAEAAKKKYTVRLGEISDELGIKSTIGVQTATAIDAKKNASVAAHFDHPDALMRAGNFLGSSRSGLASMSAKQLTAAVKSAKHLESIDKKTPGGHGLGGGTSHSGS